MRHTAKVRFATHLTATQLRARCHEGLVGMKTFAGRATYWLAVGGVGLGLLATAPAARAQDAIQLGSVEAVASGVARVPVSVRVSPATTSGPGGSGTVQAISFRVRFDPASAVASATVHRAGVLANLRPLFESTPLSPDGVGYLASFDERTNPIPFRSATSGQPDLVAELDLRLAPGLPDGTVVHLELAPGTSMLADRAGTAVRSVSGGSLSLSGSTVVVVRRAIGSGPRTGAGTEK